MLKAIKNIFAPAGAVGQSELKTYREAVALCASGRELTRAQILKLREAMTILGYSEQEFNDDSQRVFPKVLEQRARAQKSALTNAERSAAYETMREAQPEASMPRAEEFRQREEKIAINASIAEGRIVAEKQEADALRDLESGCWRLLGDGARPVEEPAAGGRVIQNANPFKVSPVFPQADHDPFAINPPPPPPPHEYKPSNRRDEPRPQDGPSVAKIETPVAEIDAGTADEAYERSQELKDLLAENGQ